jgi:hypothetical protein
MNGHSRIRLSLSAVAIIGVLMVFGQTSAFAQSAEPQGNRGNTGATRLFPAFWWGLSAGRRRYWTLYRSVRCH